SGALALREGEVREPRSAERGKGEDRNRLAQQGRVVVISIEAVPEALRPDVASGRRRLPLAWIVTLPFFAYAILFMFLPAGSVLVGAFEGKVHGYTFSNVTTLFHHPYIDSFKTSIEI